MTDYPQYESFLDNINIYSPEDVRAYEEYSSIQNDAHNQIPLQPPLIVKKQITRAVLIIRTFYTTKIIKSLEWLIEHHNIEHYIDSISHIQELLIRLHEYMREYYNDPFSSFISALYDGLTFNDKWAGLDNSVFSEILNQIISLNDIKTLSYEKIDRSINALEELGIDTTPYY